MIDVATHEIGVVATYPDVTIEGVEQSFGQPVHWIDGNNKKASFERFGVSLPDILFCCGYHIPAFRSLTAECNANNVPVILLSDNHSYGSMVWKALSIVRHGLWLRQRYMGLLVPGEAGRRYAEAMGYSK